MAPFNLPYELAMLDPDRYIASQYLPDIIRCTADLSKLPLLSPRLYPTNIAR